MCPPEWVTGQLAGTLREHLGMRLFNFDLIVPEQQQQPESTGANQLLDKQQQPEALQQQLGRQQVVGKVAGAQPAANHISIWTPSSLASPLLRVENESAQDLQGQVSSGLEDEEVVTVEQPQGPQAVAPPLCYVVDINYFPGVDKIPGFEQRFVRFLQEVAAQGSAAGRQQQHQGLTNGQQHQFNNTIPPQQQPQHMLLQPQQQPAQALGTAATANAVQQLRSMEPIPITAAAAAALSAQPVAWGGLPAAANGASLAASHSVGGPLASRLTSASTLSSNGGNFTSDGSPSCNISSHRYSSSSSIDGSSPATSNAGGSDVSATVSTQHAAARHSAGSQQQQPPPISGHQYFQHHSQRHQHRHHSPSDQWGDAGVLGSSPTQLQVAECS
eukprot:GHRR01013531.1.p1 GENE.GHRR01013531.1~~GHRR01013531.1.p1  ORF type:complete len:387 (+),score=189.49 GHRR01013531.1:1398-2558(+)